MPNRTYHRLPEEKKERLMRAAWEEFTNRSYADASINRIIQAADISRGSFYQYFKDKQDLFAFLLEQLQENVLRKACEQLQQNHGDPFESFLHLFDLVVRQQKSGSSETQKRITGIVGKNQSMDICSFLNETDQRGRLQQLLDLIDFSPWKVEAYWDRAECLRVLVLLTGVAVIEYLRNPSREEACRRQLSTRFHIVKQGILR